MTYVPPAWSDQYHGPRWRYGLVYRPLSADAFLPRDFILGSQGPATAAYPHGTVDWSHPLSDDVVKGHELILVEIIQKGVRYRPVATFPGYLVGEDGSLWSDYHPPLHQLHPVIKSNGYLKVTFRRDGRNYYPSPHRLVLEAFVGPCPAGYQCAHEDGDRTNNTLSNLQWKTLKENMADRDRHGNTVRGERQHTAKLTQAQADAIRRDRAQGVSQTRLAAQYGVTKHLISLIEHDKLWRGAPA